MKNIKVVPVILIVLICNIIISRATEPLIEDFEILFDWDDQSTNYDAISILYNEEENLYKYAYTMDVNASIKLDLETDYTGNIILLIDAKAINGSGPDLCYRNYNFNPVTDEVSINLSTENNITKYNFEWDWNITAIPICYSGSEFISNTITRITQQYFYILLYEPVAPMETPWASVLDYACDWASGQTTITSAATKITESIYASGFDYDTDQGGSRYGSWYNFNLTQFISELGGSYDVNCLDMGKAVTTFGNALGCGLLLTTFSGGFKLNCIDPIGAASPTNNTFASPLIDNDCRAGGFSYHAFAQNTSKATWDACLKYDIDDNPDNVYNSNPGCDNTTTVYEWEFPSNESEDIYIQRLVDNWSSIESCNNRYDCGYFTYSRSFSVN